MPLDLEVDAVPTRQELNASYGEGIHWKDAYPCPWTLCLLFSDPVPGRVYAGGWDNDDLNALLRRVTVAVRTRRRSNLLPI